MNTPQNPDLAALSKQVERLLALLERTLHLDGSTITDPDWQAAQAWLYRRPSSGLLRQARLHPIAFPATLAFSDLHEIDTQKAKVLANTQAFVAGHPANNVVLTGARGTGKSSLVKACLSTFAAQGLRLIEIDKNDLEALPEVLELLRRRPEKFIIYCDDLSFEAGDGSYKSLKSLLDGSFAGNSANVLVYATSNRRHLLPEYQSENSSYHNAEDGEIHPGEVIEEKISLSERFGLWVSFYPFTQTGYLRIVQHWLYHFGLPENTVATAQAEALVWALERGSRSGRVAHQFAKDYSAKIALRDTKASQ